MSGSGNAAMRAAGSVAMVLWPAHHIVRETTLLPISLLRKQGLPITVATDHNPGSSPAEWSVAAAR
jgi:imidazolonepropionase